MFQIEYEEEQWEYYFLNGDGTLSDKGRKKIILETIRLHRSGRKKAMLRDKEFEGQIVRDRFYTVGGLGGQHYISRIERV